MSDFTPSRYQRAVYDWVAQGKGDAMVSAVAGCLAGDTIVGVDRGGKSCRTTIAKLHHMLNGGLNGSRRYDQTIPTTVRSVADDDVIALGVVSRSVYSGRKRTFLLRTASGKEVRATADHRFLTPDGWVPLGALRVGSLVLAEQPRERAARLPKERYATTDGIHAHPYQTSKGARSGIVPTHRIVHEAALNDPTYEEFVALLRVGATNGLRFVDPTTHTVHHRDEDRRNKRLDNLELVGRIDHYQHHASKDGWRHTQRLVGPEAVVAIIDYAIEDTYDLTMQDEQRPNFLANGIVVHNSGKTTTLLGIAAGLRSGNAIVFAFNRHIVTEMRGRLAAKGLGVEAMTIHAYGMKALRRAFGKLGEPDDRKYARIAQDLILGSLEPELMAHLRAQKLRAHAEATIKARVAYATNMARMLRVTLSDPEEAADLAALADAYDLGAIDSAAGEGQVMRLMPQIIGMGMASLRRGVLDFTDMIYGPVRLGIQPWRWDWALVDEAQDLSAVQRELVLMGRGAGARAVWVGDPYQCQPPETLVRLTDGTVSRIDRLAVGTQVVGYDRRSASFVQRCTASEVAQRHYTGTLLTVVAGGKESRCTPNHRWLCRWIDDGPPRWITYIMRKGASYRVGKTRLFADRRNDGNGNLGLSYRFSREQADAAWVLGVFDNEADAYAAEQIVAARWGLAELTFRTTDADRHFSQAVIDRVYTHLDGLGIMEERAAACLREHGRDIQYPLLSRDADQQRRGRSTLFVTQACNLIAGAMAIPVPPDRVTTADRLADWQPIGLRYETYDGPVYSLNVERHHNYIADGLLTMNSIMGFAGADAASYQEIKRRTDAVELPLSICYRCPESHVALAKQIVPHIEQRENAPMGQVVQITEDQLADTVKEKDLILCRLTAPLVSQCLRLIRRRLPARVRGRDIAKSICEFAKTIERIEPDYTKFFGAIGRYVQDQCIALEQREGTQDKVERVRDMGEALEACVLEFKVEDVQQLCTEIGGLFTDEAASIWLSTIHRAKGLEADHVFIIKPDRLPFERPRMTDQQRRQEWNLYYVALTRAKQTLYIVRESREDLTDVFEVPAYEEEGA